MNGYENQNTLVMSTVFIKGIWSLISGDIYKKSAIVVGKIPEKNKVVRFHKILLRSRKMPIIIDESIGIDM